MTTFARLWQQRQLEVKANKILAADKRRTAKAAPQKKNKQKRLWPDQKKQRVNSFVGKTTGPDRVKSCGCNVLPWEDCEHTVDDTDALNLINAHCFPH